MAKRTEAERFWAKVDVSAGPDGCWLWTASRFKNGYGQFGRGTYAHRWAWIDANGPIPDGLELDHVRTRGCRHRHCVNPAHLEAVTHAENVRRWAATIVKCPAGHPYDAANTYRKASGKRECRTCHRRQVLESRARLGRRYD